MNKEEADTIFQKALALEDAGNLHEALKLRKLLASNFPKVKIFLLTLAKSLKNLSQLDEAEKYYKRTVKIAPKWELASLQLFHFYWDNENILGVDRKDDAFDEIRRFQSISHCDDYVEIVREINAKYDDVEKKGQNK
ncbi:MAG: tetratricopeptide repeat protein [Robiginitomaculum sp.]|nr:tetratricopeptide repeat protein [Robiginitomaculum sp.]